jgi:isopentenyl-diphosphate delta-isomerase
MVEPPRKYTSPTKYTTDTWNRTPGTKWHEVFVALIAVVATAMYVMWAALISMNTLAFQCGGIALCRADRWYMEPFNAGFFANHPGRRILVGLLLPLALLAFFWILGHISRTRYDSYLDKGHDKISSDAEEDAGSVVGLTRFWYTSTWQQNLARLHVAAVTLILAGLLGRAAGEFEAHFRVDVIPDHVGSTVLGLSIVLAALAAAGIATATFTSRQLLGEGVTWFSKFSLVMLIASIALLIASAWLTWHLDLSDTMLFQPLQGGGFSLEEPLSPNTDLWGFGWAPIQLLGVGAILIFMFSLVQILRWFHWRQIYLDQMLIPLMLALIVLWPWAIWVGAGAAVMALAVVWLPNPVAKLLGKQPVQSTGSADPWRLAVFLATCVLAPLVAWTTRNMAAPFGSDWPRMTPVLLSVAILSVINLMQTKEGWFNNDGGASRPRARLLLVLLPVALILAGRLLEAWLGRPEWFYGLVWLAWVVMAVAWLARFPFDGWRWNGPAAVAVLALAVIMGAFSGLVIWLVDLLDRGGDSFALRATGIYEWLVVAFAAMLIAVVAGFAAWYLLIRWGLLVRGDKNPWPKKEVLPEAIRALDVVVTVAAMLLVAGVAALVLHLVATHGSNYHAWIDDTAPADWRGIVQVASWISVGVALAAFMAVRSGLKDHALRTRVGILWDVASFWPRSFHPFAPPAYAVRAVPEIQSRITEIATNSLETPAGDPAQKPTAGAAILSGHSQGSVLSLAAIASLRTDVWPRVRLVTHGSPLTRFYSRFFPRYFPRSLFDYCAQGLGPTREVADAGWLNYWRLTDPIGNPVYGAQVRLHPAGHPSQALEADLDLSKTGARELPDVRLADPLEEVAAFQLDPEVRGHSGYLADPAMWRALDTIAQELDASLSGLEWVVLVDSDDREYGVTEKVAAHRRGTAIHRAVSVLLFDGEGRVLIQRRSEHKALFPLVWANTCCTHPRPGESPREAAHRRLMEELGMTAELEPQGSVIYTATDPDSGLEERELTHVFVGSSGAPPEPDPLEVADVAWVGIAELGARIGAEPDLFAPWLPSVLEAWATRLSDQA